MILWVFFSSFCNVLNFESAPFFFSGMTTRIPNLPSYNTVRGKANSFWPQLYNQANSRVTPPPSCAKKNPKTAKQPMPFRGEWPDF